MSRCIARVAMLYVYMHAMTVNHVLCAANRNVLFMRLSLSLGRIKRRRHYTYVDVCTFVRTHAHEREPCETKYGMYGHTGSDELLSIFAHFVYDNRQREHETRSLDMAKRYNNGPTKKATMCSCSARLQHFL